MNLFKKLLIKSSFIAWYFYPHDDRKPFNEFLRCAMHADHPFTGPKEVHGGYIFQKCVHWGCRYVNPMDENTPEHQLLIEINYYTRMINLIDTPPRMYSCMHHLPWLREKLEHYKMELQKLKINNYANTNTEN